MVTNGNVTANIVNGNKLVIEVDVSDKVIKNAPMSKSGKNKLVASTGGFIAVNDKIKIGLNVTAK